MRKLLLTGACCSALAAFGLWPSADKAAIGGAANANAAVSGNEAGSTAMPSRVFWGDTHLHTSQSLDVFLFGTPNATAETAYRFARGETVTSPVTGKPWKLSRPLDFLVVSDHAEMLGATARLFKGDAQLAATPTGKALLAEAGGTSSEDLMRVYDYLVNVGSGHGRPGSVTPADVLRDLHGGEQRRGPWNDAIAAAERYNEPGKFTAFVGWEWSSQPGGGNLHRIIFTPDGPDKTQQFLPFSQIESDQPEKLWEWLDATSKRTGASFTAIPHNPNLSAGLMFSESMSDGKPITAAYARERTKWERVVEATQIKGDSETHPALSGNDEFADFERYSFLLMPNGPKAPPNRSDYVRAALRRGLEIERRTGVNPFKLGIIGSSDSHTGMSAVEETAFAGKAQHDAEPRLRGGPSGLGSSRGWDMQAAGIVGVWAPHNDRRAIFDAFRRREVYASTGPRITVRMFGGFGFTRADLGFDRMARIGYARGVPMGGELTDRGAAPQFLVSALKDPMGANLDRVQMVKGWVDAKGVSHEKIFDIAWSGNRKPGANGKLPAVGNTVDLKTGQVTNSIGAVQFETLWRDPDYKPGQKAFYYLRVLQIPTARYSLLDAIALGIDPVKTGHPSTIQERAYTSPIWLDAPAKRK